MHRVAITLMFQFIDIQYKKSKPLMRAVVNQPVVVLLDHTF